MGDIYSDFLDELLSNIRTRSISWDAQQRSGLIDDSQVRTIKTIDKQRRENRAEIVSKVNFSLITARNTDFDVGSREVCAVDGESSEKGEICRYSAIHACSVD